jgi:hypothetical protein
MRGEFPGVRDRTACTIRSNGYFRNSFCIDFSSTGSWLQCLDADSLTQANLRTLYQWFPVFSNVLDVTFYGMFAVILKVVQSICYDMPMAVIKGFLICAMGCEICLGCAVEGMPSQPNEGAGGGQLLGT